MLFLTTRAQTQGPERLPGPWKGGSVDNKLELKAAWGLKL